MASTIDIADAGGDGSGGGFELAESTNTLAEIQESLTDALIEYKESNPELMEMHPYSNTMIRNVFANGWVRGNVAAIRNRVPSP